MTYGPINDLPTGYKPAAERLEDLLAPLAGIELGVYDERILRWAADMLDTPTLAVLVSLLHRARAADPLPPADSEAVDDRG